MMDAKSNVLIEHFDRSTDLRETMDSFDVIRQISIGSVAQELFNRVTMTFCKWFDAECSIVGKLVEGKRVEALSMLLDGQYVDEFSYSLDKTPCQKVVENGFIVYPENICALFPEDEELKYLKAEGYIGIPLFDTDKNPIGLINIVSRKKIIMPNNTKDIFEIVSARVSAELYRLKYEEELRIQQKFEGVIEMAGAVAHELNQPLQAISGYSELMLMLKDDTKSLLEFATNIREESVRMSEITKKLNNVSRYRTMDYLSGQIIDIHQSCED